MNNNLRADVEDILSKQEISYSEKKEGFIVKSCILYKLPLNKYLEMSADDFLTFFNELEIYISDLAKKGKYGIFLCSEETHTAILNNVSTAADNLNKWYQKSKLEIE